MGQKHYLYSSGEFAKRAGSQQNELFITTTISAYSVLSSLKKMAITITPAFSSHSWK